MEIREVCERIVVTEPLQTLDHIERSIIKTYRKDIWAKFIKAVKDYKLIEENDKVAVGISGGKDSLLLAKLVQELHKHSIVKFDVVYLAMDPGFNEVNLELLKTNCKYLDIPVVIKKSNVFAVAGKIASDNPCYMCARMRRGFLYNAAQELGCNKLALGHHFDDVIETTMLNVLYGGQFKTMVPKITADNFENIELIRPMFYIKEADIIRFTTSNGIQSMNCGCTVVASRTSSKRREIKNLIADLRKVHPEVDQSIFKASENVNINAVLGCQYEDRKYDFNDIYEERNKKK
ncbi:tRNA(Ile)-lysidine synthase TilS/MesJ [Acholeplasma morum]|uniref:tRNA 2-thiocytidine biosynthesis TtcA family protein n=1 Tax=Paracholeplasma morum TaxID=264637 RepID=UPI00195F0D1F|nr:ATP-binding protein [Paracholeplasma morum]MBM7453118.1 tRNA(Ile)-lysidine synthase TilS/MesJ [Paracholeplasma morum]